MVLNQKRQGFVMNKTVLRITFLQEDFIKTLHRILRCATRQSEIGLENEEKNWIQNHVLLGWLHVLVVEGARSHMANCVV